MAMLLTMIVVRSSGIPVSAIMEKFSTSPAASGTTAYSPRRTERNTSIVSARIESREMAMDVKRVRRRESAKERFRSISLQTTPAAPMGLSATTFRMSATRARRRASSR